MALQEAKYGELKQLFLELGTIATDNQRMPAKAHRYLQLANQKAQPHINKLEEELNIIRPKHIQKGEDGKLLTHEEKLDGVERPVKVYTFIDDEHKKQYFDEVEKLMDKPVKIDFMKLTLEDIKDVRINMGVSDFKTFYKLLVHEMAAV